MSEHQLSATKFIWISLFLSILVTNANVLFFRQDPNVVNVLMVLMLTIAATGSTITIWVSQNSSEGEDTSGDTKLKRGERVKRLIDLMDDDELYELRERLSTNYDTSSDNYVVLGADGELHHRKSG